MIKLIENILHVEKLLVNLLINLCVRRYLQGEEKDSDTENDRNNGLRMKKEMIMKEKRFSFFANQQERITESRLTFGTLPFARHTSKQFKKANSQIIINFK